MVFVKLKILNYFNNHTIYSNFRHLKISAL